MPFPCQSCNAVAINGVNCHETGCPDAWMDAKRKCRECGCDFAPEARHLPTCPDCINDAELRETPTGDLDEDFIEPDNA